MQNQMLCGERIVQTVRRISFCFGDKLVFLNLEEKNKITEVVIRMDI
jgi:hypothetical protein